MRTYSLRAIRLERGLTQTDLARLSGIAQNTISKLETYERKTPSYETVQRLANALHVKAESLKFGPDPVVKRRQPHRGAPRHRRLLANSVRP